MTYVFLVNGERLEAFARDGRCARDLVVARYRLAYGPDARVVVVFVTSLLFS